MHIPTTFERILPPIIEPDLTALPKPLDDANRAIGRALMSNEVGEPAANTAAALRYMARRLFNAACAADKSIVTRSSTPLATFERKDAA